MASDVEVVPLVVEELVVGIEVFVEVIDVLVGGLRGLLLRCLLEPLDEFGLPA